MGTVPAEIPRALVAVELDRLAASPAFRRSPRQVRLLRYLLAEFRAGRAVRLKESVIAVEVFGRGASHFDGRSDTIVRVEVGRLRRRLARYYARDGAWATLEIELPVGSYVPALRQRSHPSVTSQLPSIAVLPFRSLNDDDDQALFADGLADEITDALAQLTGVKVIARSAAAKYRGIGGDARSVAHALGVATMLEGSVQGTSAQLKVVARWVRASDGYHAWSRGMEASPGEPRQAFKERIARDIVAGLQRRLLDQSGAQGRLLMAPLALPILRRAATVDAQDAYDRARYLLRLESVDGYRRSLPILRRVLEADPGFASAHCALARALLALVGMTVVPANALLAEARSSIEHALALDPDLGEAHITSGFIMFAFGHDWQAAERAHLRGLHLAPSLPYAHSAYAWGLMFNGRFNEADSEYRFARELDPLDLKIRTHHALNCLYAGDEPRAIVGLNEVLELEPNYVVARALRGTARLWTGDTAGAGKDFTAVLVSNPGLTIGEIGLAQVAARTGHRRAARNRLMRLQQAATTTWLPPYQVAMIHAQLGSTTAALDWLDRAAHELDMNFVCAPLDRSFTPLHGDDRFGDLMAKHGLQPFRPHVS